MRLLAFLAPFVCAATAMAGPRQKVFLLPPGPSESVAASVLQSVETLILNGLSESGRFDVLGQRDIAAIVGLERQRELAGCSETDCAVQIAGALDAKLVSSFTVDRLGETTLISLRILDTQRQTVVARSSRTLQPGQDVAQACRLMIGALVTDYEAAKAEASPAVKGSSPPPRETRVIDSLDPSLDPAGSLAQGAGPSAMAAYTAAIEAERQGALLPERAQAAWTALSELEAQNPFRQQAAARALEWQAFVRRRAEDQRLAMAAVRNPSAQAGFKRFVLDQIGRTYGEDAFLPVLEETVPPELKAELCRPRIGLRNGPVLLAIRALDESGRPVRAEAELDGVGVGPAGVTYRVPTCAAAVTVREKARGLVWTGTVNLAGRKDFEVIARFPGDRYDVHGDVVDDRTRDVAWTRLVPQVPQDRAFAEAYCAGMKEDGGGWRLPGAADLASIHAIGSVVQPDTVTFPGAPEGWYWTSDDAAPAVLFDHEGTESGFSPRFGAMPAADAKGLVRCVRRNPRFAVRAGWGALTGILGVGVEARIYRRFGVAVGTGTHLLTAGLTYNRAGGEGGGLYVDAHFALVRTGLLGREIAPGVGGGASVGYDFRPVSFLSVKTGVALAFSSAQLHPAVPLMFELNAGPVF